MGGPDPGRPGHHLPDFPPLYVRFFAGSDRLSGPEGGSYSPGRIRTTVPGSKGLQD